MTIDTTKQPSIPKYLQSIEYHDTSMGTIKWNLKDISLHLEPEQKNGYLKGTELRERLKRKPVLNTMVLDWLLEHPDEIPPEWKGKAVFFWGTIYRHSVGNLCVRCLYWNGSEWDWSYDWLDDGFDSDDPALVRASALSSDLVPSSDTLSLSAKKVVKAWAVVNENHFRVPNIFSSRCEAKDNVMSYSEKLYRVTITYEVPKEAVPPKDRKNKWQ